MKTINAKLIGFIGAFISFAVIYGASSAPIPLYSMYMEEIGLTNGQLSMSSALYFIGTVISLLTFARLSNHLGRKPLVIATLIMSAISCIIFMTLDNAVMFLAGRFLQGLSCGLGSSCIAAYIVDTASGKSGAAAASSAPMIGLAGGSFGSGAIIEYGIGNITTVFVILVVMIGICAIIVSLGEETIIKSEDKFRKAVKSLKPQIKVPHNIRSFLPAASAVFVGTWGIGGFYQAFSAPMATQQLGTDNVVIAAAVFACLQAPNIIGSNISRTMTTHKAQLIGMTAFMVSVGLVIYTLGAGMTIPFLVASGLAGASWGLAYTGSMQSILSRIGIADRAGVLSTIYIISYSGAAIPTLIVGKIASGFSLYEIAIGYGALVLVTWALTMALSKNEQQEAKIVKVVTE